MFPPGPVVDAARVTSSRAMALTGMEPLLALLGIACVAYATAELVLAAQPRSRATFEAVDVDTGEKLHVSVDRRTRRDRRIPLGVHTSLHV